MGYPKKGSACELSTSRHEQYPSDSPNQSNWAHDVCKLPLIGYCFSYKFRQYPSKFQYICDETQKIFYIL